MPHGAAVRGIAELRHHPVVGNAAFTNYPWQPGEYIDIIWKPGDPTDAPTGKAWWDGHPGWQTGEAPPLTTSVTTDGEWLDSTNGG